jgi:hypothetical protein
MTPSGRDTAVRVGQRLKASLPTKEEPGVTDAEVTEGAAKNSRGEPECETEVGARKNKDMAWF